MTVQLGPALVQEQAQAIAALLNTIEHEPVSVQQVIERETRQVAGQIVQRVVATDHANQIVGYCRTVHNPWAPEGEFGVWPIVTPSARGSGAGTQLYNDALHFARQHGAQRFASEVRDDDPASLRFATQRDFAIDRHVFESVLDLTTFDTERWASVVARAEAQGVRFFSLAEIEDSEDARRRLYAVNRSAVLDIPGRRDDYVGFEEFCQFVFQASWYRADGQILAAVGDTWVGMAAIAFFPEKRSCYNTITGVLPPFRGRGIAQALKVLAIRRSLAYGAQTMRTNNDSANAPILAINQRLGYKSQPGKYRLLQPPAALN